MDIITSIPHIAITLITAVAIAVLVVAILIFISKLFIACSAVIHGDDVKIKIFGEISVIFICVLIIALCFMP